MDNVFALGGTSNLTIDDFVANNDTFDAHTNGTDTGTLHIPSGQDVDDRLVTVKDALFKIQYVMLPLFLVTGLFGNTTMASRQFKHLTSRYILIFLAISDTVLLLTQPFNKLWIIKWFGTDLRALSNWSCKVFFVIFRSAKMTSSWLVVLLCFERFVAVVFPLKAKSIIRKRFILPAIASDYIIMLCYNSIWSFSSGVDEGMCKPDLPSLEHSIFVIIGCTMYSFLPTALLLFFTPQIIFKLVKQTRFRRQISRGSPTAKSTNIYKKEEDMIRASVMVLGVMIAYIVLITPISFVHVYSFTIGVSAFDVNSFEFFVLREVAQMLEQINYAVNFFFYVLCSGTFRGRLKHLLCCQRGRSSENSSSRNTSSVFHLVLKLTMSDESRGNENNTN